MVLFCCVRKKSIGIIKMCFGGKRPDWMEEKGNCSSQGEKKSIDFFFPSGVPCALYPSLLWHKNHVYYHGATKGGLEVSAKEV